MELADVLIRVDVTKFGATDYSNADKLISQGYEAARQSVSDLLKFAIDGNAWEEYLARREARRIKSVPVPSFIQVNGTDRKSTRLNSSHRTISYAVFCLKKKKK